MKSITKLSLILSGGVVASVGVIGLATAGPTERPPRGPHVDFCPTPEQVEQHLREEGFDYKPTRLCSVEGEVQRPGPGMAEGTPGRDHESDQAAMAREKALLKSLTRGPEKDGNPATIEAITPEGEEVTIMIQTSDPSLFEGMTPAEFAEEVYP